MGSVMDDIPDVIEPSIHDFKVGEMVIVKPDKRERWLNYPSSDDIVYTIKAIHHTFGILLSLVSRDGREDFGGEEWFDPFYGDSNIIEIPKKSTPYVTPAFAEPAIHAAQFAVITLPPTVGRRFR